MSADHHVFKGGHPGKEFDVLICPGNAEACNLVWLKAVDLCLLEFDLPAKKCVLANAGMNEPILKNHHGTNYIQSIGPKFPLGLTKDTVYDQKDILVQTDDLFVVFTDGLSDSQNKDKDFYGYDRILHLLQQLDTSSISASQIKEKIMDDVQQFSGGMEQFDDMTVVVIRRNI